MSHNAQVALRAAQLRNQVGRDAAIRYCINRGVSIRLYRLACQLVAAN